MLSNKFIFSDNFELEDLMGEIIQKSVLYFTKKIDIDQTDQLESSFSLLIRFVDSFIGSKNLDVVDFSRVILFEYSQCSPAYCISVSL